MNTKQSIMSNNNFI